MPGVKQLTAYLSGEWSDKWTSFNYELQGIRVSEQQFESIYRLVETAAEAIGVDPPPTYIIQDPYPNAFVTNFEAPVLAVHSRLLEILEPKELLFVIGHELGHIKCGHVRALSLIYLLRSYIGPDSDSIIKQAAAKVAEVGIYAWRRQSEFSADLCGYLVVQDPEAASRALIKLLSGLNDAQLGMVNVEAFAEQNQRVYGDENKVLSNLVKITEALLTHPFVGNRVERILSMEDSEQYKTLFFGKKTQRLDFDL